MAMVDLDITIDQQSGVPLYEQVCQYFRQKIESSELPVGAQLPTSHELGSHLQVSYKTAHLAMATLAKEGYVTRAARRGTVVKGIPRRGVVGIYSWVELLEHGTKHEYYRMIAKYLNQRLEEQAHVYRMYLGSEFPSARNLACEDLIRHVEGGVLCGVVLPLAFPRIEELMRAAAASGTPVVSLVGEPQAAYGVSVDLWGMGRMAIDLLVSRGRRRVGIVFNGKSNTLSNRDRFAEMLRSGGCQAKDSRIIAGMPSEAGGYEAAGRLPTAELDGLVVMDDVIAMGVDRRLREMGVRVPEDLMACTYWNHGTKSHLQLPFELFEHDVKEQARLSMGLLQSAINGQRVAEAHIAMLPRLRINGKDALQDVRREKIPAAC